MKGKGNVKAEGPRPFVVSLAGYLFMIHFKKDHELHVFTCKDDPSLNWSSKHPVGTSPPDPA